MNIVAEQLMNSPTTQAFLTKFLEHVTTFFRKSKGNLSEEKTYQKLKQIKQLIQAYFPEQDILNNVCMKAISIVRIKIDDKFTDEKNMDGKQEDNFELMIKDFARKSSMEDENKQNTKRKVNEQWLKKLFIDELESLKQDINENQSVFKENLEKMLKANQTGLDPLKCVLFDSNLNHASIFQSLQKNPNLNIKASLVVTDNNNANSEKLGSVNLKNIAHTINKCDIVFISADSLLRNGGILVPSGGLMVALSANIYNKPIYILSRSFCLTEKVMIDQKNTTKHGNPLKYFKNGKQNPNKVYIAKKYDFIDAKLIKQIFTQFLPCEPVNIATMFEEYYENI